MVDLDLGHMDVRGEALVLAIEPCPALPPVSLDVPEGHVYRLVTATFSHSSGEVYDLTLVPEGSEISVGASEVISGTGMHPVWSIISKSVDGTFLPSI